MGTSDWLESLLAGAAPRDARMLAARQSPPLSAPMKLHLLVCLAGDADPGVASQATQTLRAWADEDILAALKDPGCPEDVMKHFAGPDRPAMWMQAILENPSCPGEVLQSIALGAPGSAPGAADSVKEISPDDLPADPEERKTTITAKLSGLSPREKVRYALFGSREIRLTLVRDTNRQVSRAVLRSPKLTESEVEAIAAIRNVSEDVLRDIGSSREYTKSYAVVQNLVKNPKTPPHISQRLMSRLQTRDLMLLTRDRSIPDAVRHNATRALKQRASTRST